MFGSLSGRDYLNKIIVFKGSVGHQNHLNSVDPADRLPTLFSVDLSILFGNTVRIIKSVYRRGEVETVLGEVLPFLLSIPCEPQPASSIYWFVYTISLVCSRPSSIIFVWRKPRFSRSSPNLTLPTSPDAPNQ
jgi:hypothetical protein